MAGNTEYGLSKLLGWGVILAIFIGALVLISIDPWVKWAFFWDSSNTLNKAIRQMKKLQRFIKLQKEGIIIGGIIGALLYYDFKYMAVAQFLALLKIPLDNIWIGYSALIIIGASLGALIDSLYKPKQ